MTFQKFLQFAAALAEIQVFQRFRYDLFEERYHDGTQIPGFLLVNVLPAALWFVRYGISCRSCT